MTPELEALARRAVGAKHWRWMPGMRVHWNGQRVMLTGYSIHDGTPVWRELADPEAPKLPTRISPLPDLTDAATLGCLLAMVREAWGDPLVFIVIYGDGSSRAESHSKRGITHMATCSTEAESLVAALEAAP